MEALNKSSERFRDYSCILFDAEIKINDSEIDVRMLLLLLLLLLLKGRRGGEAKKTGIYFGT